MAWASGSYRSISRPLPSCRTAQPNQQREQEGRDQCDRAGDHKLRSAGDVKEAQAPKTPTLNAHRVVRSTHNRTPMNRRGHRCVASHPGTRPRSGSDAQPRPPDRRGRLRSRPARRAVVRPRGGNGSTLPGRASGAVPDACAPRPLAARRPGTPAAAARRWPATRYPPATTRPSTDGRTRPQFRATWP